MVRRSAAVGLHGYQLRSWRGYFWPGTVTLLDRYQRGRGASIRGAPGGIFTRYAICRGHPAFVEAVGVVIHRQKPPPGAAEAQATGAPGTTAVVACRGLQPAHEHYPGVRPGPGRGSICLVHLYSTYR